MTQLTAIYYGREFVLEDGTWLAPNESPASTDFDETLNYHMRQARQKYSPAYGHPAAWCASEVFRVLPPDSRTEFQQEEGDPEAVY